MKITAKQYSESLYEAVQGKSEDEIKESVHNFVRILDKNHDLKLASEILEDFGRVWDKEEGVVDIELSSARALDSGAKEMVLEYLRQRLGVSQVNMSEKIDPALIGGFILRYGSRIIDGSLKNNLSKLRNKISN